MILPIANILTLLIMLGVIIILQIFLSKKENKYLGLILPGISFFFSIISFLGIILSAYKLEPSIIIAALMFLFIYNIPTIILMTIYLVCRKSNKNKKEIDKMNIQDLD